MPTTKKTVSKKKTATKRKVAKSAPEVKAAYDEVMRHLMMLHNPFSAATSTPKIPDGKAHKSTGFSSQSVSEITADLGQELHVLIYPGFNTMAVFDDCQNATLARTFFIPPFTDSNGVNFSALDLGTASPGNSTLNLRQALLGEYSHWRGVSYGAQLKLLNAVENDDGWWEAIRVTPGLDAADYALTTANNSVNTGSEFATLCPRYMLFNGLKVREIANESTYRTGLLRDLEKVQFELHGKTNQHEFIDMVDTIALPGGSFDNMSDVTKEAGFADGPPEPREAVRTYTDQQFDMIYIRIHPRATEPATKLHCNLVMNQEIIFDNRRRDSRYHTATPSVSSDGMHRHLVARRSKTASANYRN